MFLLDSLRTGGISWRHRVDKGHNMEIHNQTDHLHGWKAIGAHVGLSPEAVRHLARTQGLPVYKLGKTVAASKAKIDAWREARQ